MISDSYWDRTFGRDPGVIGKVLIVEDHAVSIIGVTDPEFFGLAPGSRSEITIPLSMKSAFGDSNFFTRFDNWTSMPLVDVRVPRTREMGL